jgi:hypothetical protein
MTMIHLPSGRVERVEPANALSYLTKALRVTAAEVQRRLSAGYIIETPNALFVQ